MRDVPGRKGKKMAVFEQDEAYNVNYRRLEKIALEKGYVLNQDGERLNKVIGLMTRNYREYGSYYCPCKQRHPLDKESDTLCPCIELDKEIDEHGCCTCRVFYKINL